MKTYKSLVTLFYLVLLAAMAYPASVVRGEQAQENSPWWPSAIINPPEFESFMRILDEKSKGIYILPQTTYDPQVVLVELEPHAILNTEGKLTGFRMSVLVTKRVKNRYVYRQFKYHNIWVHNLEDIFYSTLFLNRTVEENRKLAFSDEKPDRPRLSTPTWKRWCNFSGMKSFASCCTC